MKTLLIADDEPDLRLLLQTTLEDPAYRILEASDGESALQLARQEQPDVVILDRMMPKMSGLEVAQAILADPATQHIPLILLTAMERRVTGSTLRRFLPIWSNPLAPYNFSKPSGMRSARCKPVSPWLHMTRSQDFVPDDDLNKQLRSAKSQLALYAKDLKALLVREQKKSHKLETTNQQLQAYAQDLKAAYTAQQQKTRELEKAYADTVVRLTLASRYKDEETGAHIQRLSHYSKILALCIGLNEHDAQLIFDAAPMHDVGKVAIPDRIMQKQGPLDEQEWEIVKQHPILGANLLTGSPSLLLQTARDIALTHHERWDGSGYPQGLKGEAIPLGGRMVMLGDTYDALRSVRPYKPAFSHEKACDIIVNGNARTNPRHFDPTLLEAFRERHLEFDRIFSEIREEESTSRSDLNQQSGL